MTGRICSGIGRRHARFVGLPALALAVSGFGALQAGCVSESAGPGTSAGPRPNALTSTDAYRRSLRPADAIERMTLTADSNLADQNGDGVPDTILLIVNLWTDFLSDPTPITSPGSFRFVLTSLDGVELERWVFTEEQAAGSAQELLLGPVYAFGLSIGGEVTGVPARPVRLSGVFEPSDGSAAVRVDQPVIVRVGLDAATGL